MQATVLHPHLGCVEALPRRRVRPRANPQLEASLVRRGDDDRYVDYVALGVGVGDGLGRHVARRAADRHVIGSGAQAVRAVLAAVLQPGTPVAGDRLLEVSVRGRGRGGGEERDGGQQQAEAQAGAPPRRRRWRLRSALLRLLLQHRASVMRG
eukprot:359060-Chlamydomonas_euryale.AAC.8